MACIAFINWRQRRPPTWLSMVSRGCRARGRWWRRTHGNISRWSSGEGWREGGEPSSRFKRSGRRGSHATSCTRTRLCTSPSPQYLACRRESKSRRALLATFCRPV